MLSKWLHSVAGGLLLSAVIVSSGCMHWGPHLGIAVVPIPVYTVKIEGDAVLVSKKPTSTI